MSQREGWMRIAGRPAAIAIAATLAALGGACAPPERIEPASADEDVRVAVLFDIGGRGDGGFNDGAAAGAERARRAGAVRIEYAEAGTDGSRLRTLRRLAARRPDLVVAIGFLASGDATTAAREFPDVHFAVIDYTLPLDSLGRAVTPPPNLAGITFREEEGAYLVGALAGLTSRTRTVGFVGGMDSPLIHRFEAGFTAGVHRVCAGCTVESRYVGRTPAAFSDPDGGSRAAAALLGMNADVLFHAAGGSGAGAIAAAQRAGRRAIGVDVDQSALAPGTVLTSMVKRIDVAVQEVIERERAGAFRPGVTSLGLAEGGVGYVFDARNRGMIPPEAHDRVETLKAAVIAGLLTVPRIR